MSPFPTLMGRCLEGLDDPFFPRENPRKKQPINLDGDNSILVIGL